jgi:pilus assembly protein FimV
MRKTAGETSFLESRLQPDSFFGASGGQRVDTREATGLATGSSSTMSYSLSQLDAIGDVDPVAEADVYLAYGRDLQAEEILKEAMRAAPERMAIRSKLLEVYAKRRDIKGFELLATQMHNLTRGQGEDWSKAQELGRSIDPDNALYQPGGEPDPVLGIHGQPVEALGASTVPHTTPKTLPVFKPAADATLDAKVDDDAGLDLELDLPPGTPTPPLHDPTMPYTTAVLPRASGLMDLDATADDDRTLPGKSQAKEPDSSSMSLDFDLGDIGAPGAAELPRSTLPQPDVALDFGDFDKAKPSDTPPTPADGDALARKLELAEEFRQIGDVEGARDLLEEVVAKADGSLRSKAQGMLDTLG